KWMAAFLLLCVLTGCAGKTLPEGMTEEKLLTAGREVLLLAVEGEYDWYLATYLLESFAAVILCLVALCMKVAF
ncbi:MAG: hypothetical protein IJN47_01410, partial [Clostridia bacterium]|nr:hypothetical protein [Clostridia bacterium]